MPTSQSLLFPMVAVTVASPSFPKREFFGKGGAVRLFYNDHFEKCVLSEISEEVPACEFMLAKYILMRNAQEYEIFREAIGQKLFTPDEFAALLYALLVNISSAYQHLHLLSKDGRAHIFHVTVRGHIYAVGLSFDNGEDEWSLHLDDAGDEGWNAGDLVFSRVPPMK